MNKHNKALIAAYLAGEDVEKALLKASVTSAELRQVLAEDVAFERLLKHKREAKSDSQFMDDFVAAFDKDVSQKANVLYPLFNRKRFALCASLAAFFLVLVLSLSADKNMGEIVNSVGASYQQRELTDGYQVKAGRFSLSTGYAELKLINGVTLVLEGPLELDITSADKIELLQGQLVAKVPQNAIGFEVLTPSSEIIDLGTEFAVKVDKSGDSEVHVLEGEIKVRANKSVSYEHLIQNQGRTFSGDQQVQIIKSQPHLFMRVLP
ncbi:FecR family protein [Paraglaciecola aquimarina]|uniref:FecR family protein n=1 Tax=Paraglaciecola aquimarina TaxID=1235557 RepID=A0ABU3SUV2_9ALTE|nr:FecR family protein [Paraglaciecola aquimarina]MDU0353779.1 FecR family protein [Paraglaciecola aquimarina]